jgi:hypothetical protein
MRIVAALALLLPPLAAAASGHSTTANAKFYVQQLQELLRTAPLRGM